MFLVFGFVRQWRGMAAVANSGAKRVLFALTSANPQFWGPMKTGFFWPELAHPFHDLSVAGVEVDLVSLTGEAFVDEVSVPHVSYADGETDAHGNDRDSAHLFHSADSPLRDWKARIQRPDAVDAGRYDGMLFVGGHGTLWDFPTAEALHAIAGQIHARGGFIAAVCHGPSALGGIKGADGVPIIRGKRCTGFCVAREQSLGTADRLRALGLKLTDALLQEAGGLYDEGPALAPDPNAPHVVVDGCIVTGKNPKSSKGVAQAVIGMLTAAKS
jgi:putative intracellular protease/amidase